MELYYLVLVFPWLYELYDCFFYKYYTILDTPMSTFAVTCKSKTVQPKTIWDTKSAVFWSIRLSSSQSNRVRETRDLCKAFSAALWWTNLSSPIFLLVKFDVKTCTTISTSAYTGGKPVTKESRSLKACC